MANTSINNARQVHVSPGIYTKETELSYAAQSLGITTLGVAGETVKGPAFQPIAIDKWTTFQNYFGGTSTEKFRGTQYPKYELPYIAKRYLEQSQQLQVCRVLGLSGVNAGAAWLLTACGDKTDSLYPSTKPLVIGVLRSRGEHKKAALIKNADIDNGICEDEYEYDKLIYYATDVKMVASKSLTLNDGCTPSYSTENGSFTINVNDYGKFTLVVTNSDNEIKNYPVSLNPADKNYILNVLGTDPYKGETEIYVEELYDIALTQLIERGELTKLCTADANGTMYKFDDVKIVPTHRPVNDILLDDESMLTRRMVGKRFLYTEYSLNNETNTKLKVHISTDNGKSWAAQEGIEGHIYTVVAYTTADGTREYYYGEYVSEKASTGKDDDKTPIKYGDTTVYPLVGLKFYTDYLSTARFDDNIFGDAVYCEAHGMYYVAVNENSKTVVRPITLDINNYKESYRYASTPWVVSEMKGSAEHVELTKLFRFNTISDGNSSNTEVKVSITNIEPENGTFTVLVRDFYDTDASPKILERYSQCNLVPGSSNYIALKIGSTNEDYETKSKYITVEVNETDLTKVSIPAGFLGYPVRHYDGVCVTKKGTTQPNVSKPYLAYNTNVDEDIRITKQYFGLSDITGIDEDVLRYKGAEAYNELPEELTPCFHLDSRIFTGEPKYDETSKKYYIEESGIKQYVSVDGEDGYSWSTVGKGNTTESGVEPRIGNSEVMDNTIYEDIRYRKFTLAFYGGWDGWDYYRDRRSNGDDFTYQKYRGNLNRYSGSGVSFDVIHDTEAYGFDADTKAITSDYYAYLYGIRQFANPKSIDINVLATPGIDYVNQKSLVSEVIEMVENERADSVYVVTTPDKPVGAGDSVMEMYSPEDTVGNLEDSEIDSNYTCTCYPWVKYFDQDNSQYIYLPPTKDIVRNFAYTDNTAYPWFVAAGWNRGDVSGIKPKKNLKLNEQDVLYEGRINFINNFPDEGMKLWGDKNLQIHESQMNRISKRRLLLRIRKLIAIACIGLIFDPNDGTTAASFEASIKPILDDIMAKRGLIDYKIQVDDSQEARDALTLPATIFLKLQPNLEYIDINMVITPSGVSFDDI